MRTAWDVFETALSDWDVSDGLTALRPLDTVGPDLVAAVGLTGGEAASELFVAQPESLQSEQTDWSSPVLNRCGCASCAFQAEHAGLKDAAAGKAFNALPVLNETPDIAGDTSTTANLGIPATFSADVNASGDRDWFRVTLTAGQTYTFTLDGSGATPLSDPLLRLHDSTGTLITEDDDGGPGLNSQLVFTASTSGTFYLNAGAYTTQVGGYTLGAALGGPPPPPLPSYSLASTINWGGDSNRVQGNVIDVYLGGAGDTFVDDGTTYTAVTPTAAQAASFTSAFATIQSIIPVTFNIVGSAIGADFRLYWADLSGIGALGFMNPPNFGSIPGLGAFNSNTTTHNDLNMNRGGIGWITTIHELGHGLGLAHPHDTGGNSNVIPGITNNQTSTGLFELNQGPFTTMTYVDGWRSAPWGAISNANLGYGFQGGFSPIDIAVLQAKYGAAIRNNGNDTYTLVSTNAVGTFYDAIWDTGGTDTIQHIGTAGAIIDLRAASLQWEVGGGGRVSAVSGIYGGFTIANGVLIENATGGSGNDTITGNTADNVIRGNAGSDIIDGGLGSDAAILNTARANVFWRASVSAGVTTMQTQDLVGGQGTDDHRNIETFQFNSAIYGAAGVQQNHLSNMDGARFEDVLFRNTSNGGALYMDMNAGAAAGWSNVLGSLAAGWFAFASGDATGDFRADLFVQNTANGAFYLYNLASNSWTTLNASITSAFAALDVGEFTGDGTTDVLLRNTTTGAFFVADLGANGAFEQWLSPASLSPADWRYVGTGDFDRDGVSDIVLQQVSTGITYYRDINAGGVGAGWGTVFGSSGTPWFARTVGDFNGDGFDDVVFQNLSTGQVIYANMLGGANAGWGLIANGMSGWTPTGTADIDNDGYADVLFRNDTSGLVVAADMNAGAFSAWVSVANPGTGWVVV